MQAIPDIGLIIIGDELISGKREDSHFNAMIKLFATRNLEISWVKIIGDAESRIIDTLAATIHTNALVFSFGGIGATPDDRTRSAAAQAAQLKFGPHPEALKILRDKYGSAATPQRLVMAELPDNAALIPNPVGTAPGFSINHHHFLPGFPSMAHNMAQWVLDNHYPDMYGAEPIAEQRYLLRSTPESDIADLMSNLMTQYTAVRISSLPGKDAQGYTIELGVRGPQSQVPAAAQALLQGLELLQLKATILATP